MKNSRIFFHRLYLCEGGGAPPNPTLSLVPKRHNCGYPSVASSEFWFRRDTEPHMGNGREGERKGGRKRGKDGM